MEAERFERLMRNGLSPDDAAKQIGRPRSTLYRWLREFNYSRNIKAISAQEHRGHRAVALSELSNALDAVYHYNHITKEERLLAIFKISVWMQVPVQGYFHHIAVACCLIEYAMRKHSCATMADIPSPLKTIIEKNISLYTFQRILNPSVVIYEPLSSYEIWEQPHTTRDVLADICSTLLFDSDPARKGPASSLSKAYEALEAEKFKYNWSISRTAFNHFMRQQGPSMPFLFAERNSPLSWELDPAKSTFLEDVDDILNQPRAVQQFISLAKRTAALLINALDPRTAFLSDIPTFPDSIPAANLSHKNDTR